MQIERESPIAVLGWIARARALAAKSYAGDAENWLLANGAPERARRIFAKAAVPAGSTASSDIGDYGVASWADTSLRTQSAFYRILADGGFYPAVLNKRIGISSTPATGSVTNEGDAVPLSPVSLQTLLIHPMKAASLIVLTDTLLNDVSSSGQQMFNRELVGAVSAAVDGAFVSMFADTGTTIASSGNGALDAWNDLRQAMLAVSAARSTRIYMIAAPDVAVRAATLPTTDGAQVFVAADPSSGSELVNRPLLISSGVPAGSLIVVDAASVAVAGGPIDVRESRQATVSMLDNPTMDSSTPEPAQMVSLWQANLVGLMATAVFGAELLRPDGIAVIEGITWGGA